MDMLNTDDTLAELVYAICCEAIATEHPSIRPYVGFTKYGEVYITSMEDAQQFIKWRDTPVSVVKQFKRKYLK